MEVPIEIRCPIHGPIKASRAEMKIVDSPYFQRLRGIKQMGFAELAFPGATHNRYIHSLGAFHLAGRVFEKLFQGFAWKSKDEENRVFMALRMAALLHDVGHGPLSHAIEQAMPARKDVNGGEGQATHEDYTEAIILRSQMNQLLIETFGAEAPEAIASLIRGEAKSPDFFTVGKDPVDVFPALSSAISGEIDVDRMDYMKRDSFLCGTTYGQYDQNWIFSNLLLNQIDHQMFLGIDARAVYAIEDFLLSRYHMYLMVYLHHKAVVYDEMLFQFLCSEADTTKVPSSIEEYLFVDDNWLYSRLRKSKNEWARRIIGHKPFKLLLELHSDQTEIGKKYADELEARLIDQGMPYFRSSSTGLLSKYTSLSSKTKNFPLYVIYRDPRFTSGIRPGIESEPLSDATELFSRYQKKRIIDRIYAATSDIELSEKIDKAVGSL